MTDKINIDFDEWTELTARLEEYRRMYAALLEIKRHFETEGGKFSKQCDKIDRQVWNIACKGLGK